MNLPSPETIRPIGLQLGFARVGFASLDHHELAHQSFFLAWLEAGMAGSMAYLARGAARRGDPRALLPEARAAVVTLAHHGDLDEEPPAELPVGRLARYARGPDYHRVLGSRLRQLADLTGLAAHPHLVAVDTAPLLERELAVAAGLGFIGKNTLLISPGLGSYTLIGVLLTAIPLPGDAPVRPGCGRCRLCLEACPPRALPEPYLLDARRCSSCLTIEQRGPLPEPLAAHLAPWIFGCDRCQEVCPFNRRRRPADAELARDRVACLDLVGLLGLRSSAYRRLVRGRALSRISRPTLARNAALVAGGTDHRARPDLRRALESAAGSDDPGLAAAARWALRPQQS